MEAIRQQESVPVQSRQLRHWLRRLAEAGAGGQRRLSVYLDLRSGQQAALRHLAVMLRRLRRAHAELDDQRIERFTATVQAELRGVPSSARCLACFEAPRHAAGPVLTVPLAVPVAAHACCSPFVDVAPLLRVGLRYGRLLLVWLRDTSIQVSEIDLGVSLLRCWSATPQLVHRDAAVLDDATASGRTTALLPARTLRSVERALRAGRQLPIVLAGRTDATAALRQRLPQALRARVIGSVDSPAERHYGAVLDAALTLQVKHNTREALALGNRLLSDTRSGRLAVAGPAPTLNALYDGTVETVVIVNELDPSRLRPDTDPETLALEARLALLQIALRQGVDVELVPAQHALRGHDGIGCVLRRPAEPGWLPIPAIAAADHRVA